MQATRRRDTRVELLIRRALHRAGLRFRVDTAAISGSRRRADIVFRPAQVAVFVDGCFWHSCPEHGTIPRANHQWWVQKLNANVERDRRSNEELERTGWLVLRYWEHDDPDRAAREIAQHVAARRACQSESRPT